MGIALREQIHQAKIDIAASGTIIAGVAGKITTIIAMVLVNNIGTTSIIIKDGTTALTGAMLLAAGVPLVLPPDPTVDWFQSAAAGNDIVLTLGAGTQVSGAVWYVQN